MLPLPTVESFLSLYHHALYQAAGDPHCNHAMATCEVKFILRYACLSSRWKSRATTSKAERIFSDMFNIIKIPRLLRV